MSENNKKKRINEAYDYLRFHHIVSTQVDVASAMKTTPPNISAALAGNPRVLTDSFIRRFCHAFPNHFSLDYMLTGEGELLLNVTTQQPKSKEGNDTFGMIDSISYLISNLIQNYGRMKDEIVEIKQQLANAIEENKRLREAIISDRAVISEIRKELATIRRVAISKYSINQESDLPMAAEHFDL